MRAILPTLLALTIPAHAAEESLPVLPKKNLSSISMLPDGSQLHGVMFPHYDEDQQLVGVLKARAMTLVNKETVAGDDVEVEFYNPDQTPRGHVNLRKAVFDQTKGTLTARETVKLSSDRINAEGAGLVYAFDQGEGFLTGPVVTWMKTPTETAMNHRPHPLRAAALLGMSLVIQPLVAAPGEPAQGGAEATTKDAKSGLRADLEASEAATRAAKEFLEKADIISKSGAGASPAIAPPTAPLDVKPGPTDTIITCDGGMYFDADKGLFVYLKNVRVTDPRFTLTGANKLEIHLAKKPEGDAPQANHTPKPGSKAPGIGLGAKFGDVQSVIATGAVRITQKEAEAGKEPVQASGAIFTYHPGTGDITLSGGYPWVLQGSTFMRAEEPDLSLHINKSGSFKTEGKWKMGGNLEKTGKKQP